MRAADTARPPKPLAGLSAKELLARERLIAAAVRHHRRRLEEAEAALAEVKAALRRRAGIRQRPGTFGERGGE